MFIVVRPSPGLLEPEQAADSELSRVLRSNWPTFTRLRSGVVRHPGQMTVTIQHDDNDRPAHKKYAMPNVETIKICTSN